MSGMDKLAARFPIVERLLVLPRPVLMGAAAGLVALIIVSLLWMRGPDYKVLFSNLQDKDGGAIVTALEKLNVPYQFNNNGSAILIPADKVHETRMMLAEQGLPQGGGVGFELMDDPQFGASQFAEQVTYQRAVEGELARSIEAMNSVESARVHLAIPKQTLFVRDRKLPTASVLVTLSPGRSLGDGQIAAIAWLVASSVPGLTAENVSIVDQSGRLLSSSAGLEGIGANQTHLKFTDELEQRLTARIISILVPVVGRGNVHAQVSASMDFAQREQTSEIYRPNQKPDEAAIRSEQTNRTAQAGVGQPMGIPGALSNEPPAPPVAPIENPPGTNATAGTATTILNPASQTNNATINYELDRTISHVKDSVGTIKRLSVAVVVNYRENENGEASALPPETMQQINALVKEAVGFSDERGDSLNVVNSEFTSSEPQIPVWKDPEMHSLAKTLGQYLLLFIAVMLIWLKAFKPLIRALEDRKSMELAEKQAALRQEEAERKAKSEIPVKHDHYEDNLNVVMKIAAEDPRAVAMVLRTWMNQNNDDSRK
ncbi:flagellar basal-body MS-ring/collar protein FliF [Advenella alkanexedens]|uniref:flagellar basal-body MS-ring/collar protein FliF n=1 Tax=Advenella alkanexedens TaxID=1481665 RepID=UPI002674B6FD|nr:flagellar basal-body MS-ring/collar protein FliF [Advenella alkanexedens]WKU18156.1 flagellar basal-body MS-ring/collar protein FliF [Advenella alkanexedens]